jgi:hypothetical protein
LGRTLCRRRQQVRSKRTRYPLEILQIPRGLQHLSITGEKLIFREDCSRLVDEVYCFLTLVRLQPLTVLEHLQ